MSNRKQLHREAGIFCSTVIATIGHPKLSMAVRSVLDQEFTAADFEVIVVNDSGQALPDMDWQHSERVRVVSTLKRERSVARNTGAALARGKYLHILDQDDMMLPGALQAFWELDQISDAVWLCGSYQLVDDEDQLLEEHQASFDGDVLALAVLGEIHHQGASLLRADEFFQAGAFDPNFHIVEDIDLFRRLAFLGCAASTPTMVARIRRSGGEASSGDWTRFATNWRRSTETTFGRPNVLRRLEASARDRGYWRGRIARHYLASAAWNLKQGNLLQATNRLGSLAILTRWYAFSRSYWRGVRKIRAQAPDRA
jgi:glycosyltransferase involved in cell wall biosynthesis